MRFALFISLLLSTQIYAQEKIIAKMDSVHFCEDGMKIITFKGKKSGLCVKEGNFIVKPAKQTIVYIESHQLYAILSEKRNWILFADHDGKIEEMEWRQHETIQPNLKLSIEGDLLIVESFLSGELWTEDDEYFNLNPGFQNSGVYNIAENRWVIPPVYGRIYHSNHGWLTSNEEYIKVDMYYDRKETFQLWDNQFNEKAVVDEREKLFEEREYLDILISEYNVDTVFEGPADFDNVYRGDRNALYFRSGENLGIVYPNLESDTNLYELIKPDAFVHSNKELGVVFKCDRDNLILEIDDSIYSVKKEDAKIEIVYPVDGYEVSYYNIHVIKGQDTTVYKGKADLLTYSLNGDLTASIQYSDNRLIINENAMVSEYMMDSWGELFSDGYYNLANSAIWEYRDNRFMRATPFYSFIEPNEFGYVVKTIGWSGEPIEVDGFYQWDKDGISLIYNDAKPTRYLLLGKDLKAVSFLDYYDFDLIEDLGYGLCLTTDKGKMFVDYSGAAITSDEWDQFEVEDGKLKALKLNDLIDEYGEPYYMENGKYYDWEGNEFDPIKELKYFDLKK